MKVRKTLILSAFALSLGATGPAFAQAAPAQGQVGITAGAAVRDTNGGEVGTISRVDGQYVILKTDKHEVRLPAASFTAGKDALLFAMTRDQLNAEVEKSVAAANAKLVPGTAVTGSAGSPVGTIDTIDDQFVTLKLTSGKLVRLPRTGIAPGPNGAVVGATAAQLEAAAAAAAPAAAADDAATTAQPKK